MSNELRQNLEERMLQTEELDDLLKIAKAYKDVSDADSGFMKADTELTNAQADKILRQEEMKQREKSYEIDEHKIETEAKVKCTLAAASILVVTVEGIFNEAGVIMKAGKWVAGKLIR